MMALTKLEVAPATVDLFSLVLEDSFLIRREVPPGVETLTSLRGVEGAKKGEAGGLMEVFAMVDVFVGCTDRRLCGWRNVSCRYVRCRHCAGFGRRYITSASESAILLSLSRMEGENARK